MKIPRRAVHPKTPIFFLLLALLPGSGGAWGQEQSVAVPPAEVSPPSAALAAPAGALAPQEEAAGSTGRFGTGAGFPHLVYVDLRDVLGAPLSWKGPQWRRFSLAVAGVGAAALLDGPVRDAERRDHNRFVDRVTNAFEPLGSTDAWVVVGLFYAGGVAADDTRARSTAVDAVLSTMIANGIITSALKPAVGRKRPRDTGKTFDFAPFGGGQSFPSGHATHAFAVASVIATHYDSRWIKGVSYGSAAIVAFARVHHQAHFLSDVTAGALIGTAVGRSVVRHNQAERRSRYALVPVAGPRNQPGMAVSFSF
jgi:membrane-associated phospholipid phosphatase